MLKCAANSSLNKTEQYAHVIFLRSRHVRHVKDSGEGKYHMTHMSVLRSYISNHMFFVTVRAFPAPSKSCELSGQTWCRRRPAPRWDFSPWQQKFVETKSRDAMKNKRRRRNRAARCDLCWCDCWLTLAVVQPARPPPVMPRRREWPCCSCFSHASLCTQATIPLEMKLSACRGNSARHSFKYKK